MAHCLRTTVKSRLSGAISLRGSPTQETSNPKSTEVYQQPHEPRMSPLRLVFALVLVLDSGLMAPVDPEDPEDILLDLETDEDLDLNIYDSFNYDDLDQEIRAPSPDSQLEPVTAGQEEDITKPTSAPAPVSLDFMAMDLFGPDSGLGMPTCLLCVCLSGSVYCDDSDLDEIPPLPKDTTHFYGRFNKIQHIKNTTFINLNKLQSIDLSGNLISKIDQDAFQPLERLQQLVLADNKVKVMPELPNSMKLINLRNNKLSSSGVHLEGFQDMSHLEFLYLSDNELDYIPTPLPLSLRVLHLQNNNIQSLHMDTFCHSHDPTFIRRKLEDIRLDGNPLNINLFAPAYSCLPRLPVGSH